MERGRPTRILLYAGSPPAGADQERPSGRATAGGRTPPVVAAAVRLARASGAELVLVDVVEEIPEYIRRLLPASWNVAGLVQEQRQQWLEQLARRARRSGVDAATRLVRGSAVVALVDEVVRGGYDLLMLDGASTDVATAAVGRRLVRKCPCPVWLVGPARLHRQPHVLAAIDPTSTDPLDVALTAKVIETALEIAESLYGTTSVLHAWTAPGEFGLRGRAGVSADVIRQYVADTERAARCLLSEAIAPFAERLDARHVHLVKGDAAAVISAAARHRGADVVVIGSVARTGLGGLLIGNTAEAVLDGLPSSVLVVKPDGFVSPLARELSPPESVFAGG